MADYNEKYQKEAVVIETFLKGMIETSDDEEEEGDKTPDMKSAKKRNF